MATWPEGFNPDGTRAEAPTTPLQDASGFIPSDRPGTAVSGFPGDATDPATTTPTSVLGAPPAVAAGSSFVTPEATVSGQLETLLQKGSPLMTLAESRAAEEANKRGLLSSSMAVGAGQKALYDTGLEIAKPDAATHAKFGLGEQEQTYGLQEKGYTADLESVMEASKAGQEKDIMSHRFQLESELSAQAAEQAITQQREVDAAQMARLEHEQTSIAAREAEKILSQERINTEKMTTQEMIEAAKIEKDIQINAQKLVTDLELADMETARVIAQTGMQVDAENQKAFSDSYNNIIKNYNADFRAIQEIPKAEMDAGQKETLITQMQNQVQNEIVMLGELHGWNVEWDITRGAEFDPTAEVTV